MKTSLCKCSSKPIEILSNFLRFYGLRDHHFRGVCPEKFMSVMEKIYHHQTVVGGILHKNHSKMRGDSDVCQSGTMDCVRLEISKVNLYQFPYHS